MKYDLLVQKEICTRYQDGESTVDIGKIMKIPTSTVYCILKRHDIRIRTMSEIKSKINLQQAGEMYKEGMSINKIGKKLNFSPVSIFHALKRVGIQLRSPKEIGETKRILTREKELRVILDYNNGMWSGELGRKYGVSKATIQQVLKREGFDISQNKGGHRRGSFPRYGKEKGELIGKLYKEGLTSKQVAKKLDVSEAGVQYALTVLGIERRKPHDYLRIASDEEIKKLYVDEELSIKQVAKKLGYKNAGPISLRLKKMGIMCRKIPNPPRKIPNSNWPLIAERYNKGESSVDIAKSYNVHKATIIKILKNQNVTIRQRHRRYTGPLHGLSYRLRGLAQYKEWRENVLKRDNYTCQNCGVQGSKIQADHKAPFKELFAKFVEALSPTSANMSSLAIQYAPFWDIDNGQSLCKSCHMNKTRINKEVDQYYL